jgi:hypothetical protein
MKIIFVITQIFQFFICFSKSRNFGQTNNPVIMISNEIYEQYKLNVKHTVLIKRKHYFKEFFLMGDFKYLFTQF